ncbi:rhodanese-like domain-containing protein [Desulfuribacillus alkaliarsenatis]|uniref:Rhodanese domain-containing protein n=1 Tax=Desulfuribacillus alkaliarsenatis TaxID=766136 RepID=A0A1E5G1V5_9FIRM|nr:rhodanese-like domain-containing protein [Desulfuribacillus alkaliarsenatis]OEF96961.1 hypothetical protein BHF68_04980 [Desulfuribacillus alkaliarsenatis]
MKKSLVFFILIILSMTAIVGCSSVSYKNVTSDQAKTLLEDSTYILLDVRTTEEYRDNHVPGSILIPVQELELRLDELDKDKKYLVLCRSGNRSVTASEILIEHGFGYVYNVMGGINQW